MQVQKQRLFLQRCEDNQDRLQCLNPPKMVWTHKWHQNRKLMMFGLIRPGALRKILGLIRSFFLVWLLELLILIIFGLAVYKMKEGIIRLSPTRKVSQVLIIINKIIVELIDIAVIHMTFNFTFFISLTVVVIVPVVLIFILIKLLDSTMAGETFGLLVGRAGLRLNGQ